MFSLYHMQLPKDHALRNIYLTQFVSRIIKSHRLVLIPLYTPSAEHSTASASDIIVDNIIKIIVQIIATTANHPKRHLPSFSERFISVRSGTTQAS